MRIAVAAVAGLAVIGQAACSASPLPGPPPQAAVSYESPGITVVEGSRLPAGSSDGEAKTAARPPSDLAGMSGARELILETASEKAPDLSALPGAKISGKVRFQHTYFRMGLPSESTDSSAIAKVAGQPGVLSAQPNTVFRHSSVPPTNDPLLPSQWSYEPDVADVYGAWQVLGTLPADRIASMTVAVIDSGVDPDHPDLRVLPGYDTTGSLAKGQAVATSSFDPKLDDHGTGVAGIVGALANNNLGAAGVAPGVSILPIKVERADGTMDVFSILQALSVAAHYNRSDSPFPNLANPLGGKVRVVNLSLINQTTVRSAAFDDAFSFLRDRGIVVCVAAGNYAGPVQQPANSPYAVGVSATFQYLGVELLAPYSCRGPEIWVAAPGNFLWTTAKKGDDPDYSNAYQLFNGTSAAAPFAAGVAALIDLVYSTGGPTEETAAWTDRVRNRLANTADDLGPPGFDDYYGWGRVNARKAVTGPLP